MLVRHILRNLILNRPLQHNFFFKTRIFRRVRHDLNTASKIINRQILPIFLLVFETTMLAKNRSLLLLRRNLHHFLLVTKGLTTLVNNRNIRQTTVRITRRHVLIFGTTTMELFTDLRLHVLLVRALTHINNSFQRNLILKTKRHTQLTRARRRHVYIRPNTRQRGQHNITSYTTMVHKFLQRTSHIVNLHILTNLLNSYTFNSKLHDDTVHRRHKTIRN